MQATRGRCSIGIFHAGPLASIGLASACPAVVNLPRSDQPGETGIPAIETAALLIVVVSAVWARTLLRLGIAEGGMRNAMAAWTIQAAMREPSIPHLLNPRR